VERVGIEQMIERRMEELRGSGAIHNAALEQ
jgi:hypothetical protein